MDERRSKMFINYFKKWEGASVLGIVLAAIGFLMLWLGWSYFSYIAATTLMPVGLAVFLYGSTGRASEADLAHEIESARQSIAFEDVDMLNELRRRGRLGKNAEDAVFEAYAMKSGLYMKKMKNGDLASSEFVTARMLLLSDSFLIKKKRFSFVCDESKTESFEIPFSDVREIAVERKSGSVKTIDKKPFSVKICRVKIVYGEQKTLYLPTKDNIYVDEFVEKVKRIMGDAT